MTRNPDTVETIVDFALTHLDFNQVMKDKFNTAHAEDLGKKFGNFYKALYRGVEAALIEEVDEVKLGDAVSARKLTFAPMKKLPSGMTKSKLNDVIFTKTLLERKAG